MAKKIVLYFFLLQWCSIMSIAQVSKQTEHFNRAWLGYFNQSRFSNKWGLWAEVQLRTKEDFIDDLSQGIIRGGLTYYIADATKVTLGYAFVNDFPGDNHKNISVPEHRPWQQVQWHTNYGKKKMMQWIRLEQRYRHKIKNDDELAEGYNFNWRIRYNLWYEIPFIKNGKDPRSWSFIANNEVMINFGRNIVNNYFDQDRFFLGVKYQMNKQTNLQVGYMNLFQQLPTNNQYRSMDVIRVFLFQNLDFRDIVK